MTARDEKAEHRSLEHVTVLEIDGRGVLIHGASGSGKTSLAVELLYRCANCSIESALVADDYAFVVRPPDAAFLMASVPERTAGLIELRGFGVVEIPSSRYKPETRLVLAVYLGTVDEAERVADPDRQLHFHGVGLPELALLARSPVTAACAVLGWLGLSAGLIGG